MTRTLAIVVMVVAATVTVLAQEPVTTGSFPTDYRVGWTLTPSMGFGQTWDDNISLSGVYSGPVTNDANDDIVQNYLPGADLHYEGRHTQFGIGYGGSFLAYRTFSALNRWNQHGRLVFKRQETARLKWFGNANVQSVPSTDFVDLGGVPFRRTGTVTSDGRGGASYALSARNSIVLQGAFQTIHFEEPLSVDNILHGGRVYEGTGGWRHRVSERVSLGTDYSFRRAIVVSDDQPFDLHSVEGGGNIVLSPSWTLSGSAGVVYLTENATTSGRVGPAWRVAIEQHRQRRALSAEFLQSYVPSFGYGGIIKNQEASVSLFWPLFHSRHFYTEQRLLYRDDEPLTTEVRQLPLRSVRTHSVLGWSPQPWVRLEAFYARTQQTNFQQFGQLYRNRFGFQIVTSKPVRMQ